jgi:flagella basal body P-ring formation protein FlgA
VRGEQSWRIRFLEAAVVEGEMVRLGEVAVPVGDMPAGLWESFAAREIWPAPPEGGRAVNMTRPRLQEAVMRGMKDLAPYCLFPGSMAVQRGGVLMNREAVQRFVEQELAPRLASLPGETMLKDFRLPHQIFLEHAGQEVALETPRKIEAGRISIRLVVREMDGSVRQKLTGTVFADCWAEVPCAGVTMNRDELLEHSSVTFKRMNLAALRGEPWDGRGGPWRLTRPVVLGQVIYQSDVAHIPTVRKGSTVTLIYEGKNVRLSVQAEALADGASGENIPVRNKQSRREVFGLIRDSQTVTVAAMP